MKIKCDRVIVHWVPEDCRLCREQRIFCAEVEQSRSRVTQSNTPSWYIVQVKPNSHKIAVRNLQRQGFDTFLPMHEVTRRTAAKFETVIRPLFA